MRAEPTALVDDVTIMVAGTAGDGSLSLVDLLAAPFGRRGFHLYQSRSVASRVKGGHAAAYLRASMRQRGCLGDRLDLLVAFDEEAIERGAPRLAADACVVCDSSAGAVPAGLLPEGATVIEIPFGRLAVQDLRRELYKNSITFGVLGVLLGIDETELETTLRKGLARLPEPVVEANVAALSRGLAHVREQGLAERIAPWQLDVAPPTEHVLLSGNEAASFGFLAAGGRFFAGYPITPATEILEWLAEQLPAFDGVALQAEDELAAINMALGAAMAGARAMTATSGPGLALMQEAISHAGAAEIPVVIVDSQRAGPSTGMPTKPEQGDVGMALAGSTGDFPRVVLAPGDPADAFELTARSLDLAEMLQGPVLVLLDQLVAQDAMTVDRFDLDALRIDRGKLLSETDVDELAEYRRYRLTDDGVSPWAIPGTRGGQSLITGNERDEWGRVSIDPGNRQRMTDKRLGKVAALEGRLPGGRATGDPQAAVGLLGFGMQSGTMREAAEQLDAAGVPARVLQVRTLWPVPEETAAFVAGCERVYVVEQNAGAQYRRALAGAGLDQTRLRSVLRYDGLPFCPAELAARILDEEGSAR